jgi:hypothetical protein
MFSMDMARCSSIFMQPKSAVIDAEFTRGLGLYDSVMVVAGSMIGSGIFILNRDGRAFLL